MLQALLNDSGLRKHLRAVPKETFLFKQGDKGNTMFLIVDGTFRLTQKTGNQVRVVDTLGVGEFLGERALFSENPFRRGLSAEAVDDATVLELDHRALETLQAKVPGLCHQVLRTIVQRQDKANELVGILQLKSPADRMVYFLLYAFKYHGTKSPQGKTLLINSRVIEDNINVGQEVVDQGLDHMTKSKVLIKEKEGFALADEAALVSVLGTLKDTFG